MAADLQDANAVAVEAGQAFFDRAGHGHPLPRYRPSILESGRADFAYWHIKAFGNLPREILRPEVALFDPQIEKLATARRQVRRNFFDLEVLRDGLNAAAETGKIGGEHRRSKEEGMIVHADWFMNAVADFSFEIA